MPALLLGGALLRLILAAVLPPGYDEAYYLFYGRDLHLSYFDHPIAVGVWSWLGQALGTTPLTLRIPSVISYTAALWLLHRATARWFGGRAGLWALLLGSLCPLVFLCGGVLLLPDSPLVLALGLLLWWLSRHPHTVPDSPREAVELGAILAAVTLSKYHALLLLPSLLAFTLSTQPGRTAWLRPWPWLSLLSWAMLSAPLWLWNSRHGWVSLLFHAGRTGQSPGYSAEGSLMFLLSQMGMLFPTIGVLLVWMLLPSRGRPRRGRRAARLLRWLVWPQVIVFLGLAGRMQVMASWLVPAWWLLLPLAARWLASCPRPSAGLRWTAVTTASVLPPLLLGVAGQMRWGWLQPLLPGGSDPSGQLMTPVQIRQALAEHPSIWRALRRADVIASPRYEMPGFLALALQGHTAARFTAFGDDPRGFAFWDPADGFQGARGVVFAPVEPGQPLHRRPFAGRLGPMQPLGVVQVRRAGEPTMALEFVQFGPLPEPYPRPFKP